MADNNLSAPAEPDVTTPPTEESLVEDISNLLDDPSPDPVEEPEDEAAAPPEDDDPLGLGAEDVDADEPEEPDGSDEPEIKGGRFAPDSAKVTLDDGTVITVSELKRNNLFQRDYTKKTTELKARETEVETLKSEVSQYAQSLDESREYLAWYAEQHLPKKPEEPTDPQDFVAWHNYRLEHDKWAQHVQAFQKFKADKEADGQKKAGETDKQTQERLKRESEALFKAIPVLKDPVKGKQVWAAMVAGAEEHYGISETELNAITDHRILLGLRDALGYRRIKKAAPTVQAQVTKKPAVRDGRRAAPNAAVSREKQVRSERLRTSGNFNDGVAALSDLDL